MIKLYTPGRGIYIRDDDGRYYPVGQPPDHYRPNRPSASASRH